MARRPFIAAAAIALLLPAATARAQGVTAGVKGGVSIANIQFIEEEEHIDFDSRVGFTGGLFVVWPATAPIALQMEALYGQRGASIQDLGTSVQLKLDYFEVPVLARLSTPRNASGTAFHVFGGPSFALRVRARGTATFDGETQTQDIGDDLSGHDVGLVAGAGLEAGRFIVDARYVWGLTNLNRNPREDDTTVKHRVFAAMAGFRF